MKALSHIKAESKRPLPPAPIGRLQDVYRYLGAANDTMSTKSTHAEALHHMTKENLEALVVIDEGLRLKGVVERGHVISKIMLSVVT